MTGNETEQNTDLILEEYLQPGEYVDSDHPQVVEFAQRKTQGCDGAIEKALALYLAVRDDITYDPYFVGRSGEYFRASDCLANGRGFCIPKAALMAAGARALGIPARVGYADVRNHLTTEKLDALVGGNLYRWHSYTELYLAERWVKATPAFNKSLCERFGVHTLEFNGRDDSLLQEFDCAGRQHMEYVRQRGHFPDVPYEQIMSDFIKYHQAWLDYRESSGGAPESWS